MNKETGLPTPQIDGATNPGARGKHNDDYADHFRVKASQNDRELTVLALGDGVTSTGSGDQASRIAVETTKKSLRQDNNKQPLRQRLEQAVCEANQEIWRQAQANPDQRNMSTTLVLAAIDGNQLRVVHVGDSRAYLVRDGNIYCLTLDHTWVQEALDVGRLDEKSARHHPNRHVIQRYLGISQHVEVDHTIILPGTYHLPPPERKRVETLALQAGDVLLLCSDGLTESVNDEEIKTEVLRNQSQPKQVAEALVELALERNERDNITVLLLSFPSPTPVAIIPRQVAAPVKRLEQSAPALPNRWLNRAAAVLVVLILACLSLIGLGNLDGKAGMQVSSAATIRTSTPPTDSVVVQPPPMTPTAAPAAQVTTIAATPPVAVAVNVATATLGVQQPEPTVSLLANATKALRVPTDELPTTTPTRLPPTLPPTKIPTRAPTSTVAPATTAVVARAAVQFRALNLKPSEDLVIKSHRELSFQVEPQPDNGERFLIVGWQANAVNNNQFACLPPASQALRALSNATALRESNAEIVIALTDQELRARGVPENTRYCWGVSLDSSPYSLLSQANESFKLRIESTSTNGSNEPSATQEPPPPISTEQPSATPVPTEPPAPTPEPSTSTPVPEVSPTPRDEPGGQSSGGS